AGGPEAGAGERYGDEPARLPPGGVEAGHGRGEVGGDTWQAAVLQRVDRVARTRFEPYGGPRHPEGRGPIGAQPAAPERRLRLPAAGAPWRTDRAPAMTAHVAHQPGGIPEREEGAAQQTLGRQEELLDRLTHQGRGSRRRASPRAVPFDPGRSGRMPPPLGAPAPRGRPAPARPQRSACAPS